MLGVTWSVWCSERGFALLSFDKRQRLRLGGDYLVGHNGETYYELAWKFVDRLENKSHSATVLDHYVHLVIRGSG